MTFICSECGKSFEHNRPNVKTCSLICYKQRKKLYYGNSFSLDVSPGTKGAITELAACNDLMKKGFHVFRAVSPSSNFDLVAYKNNKLFSFEVRTGHIRSDGVLSFLKKESDEADYYAVVVFRKEGELVIYKPDLL